MSGFRWSGQTVPRLPDWRCYRTRISIKAVKPIVSIYHGKYITRSEKITALSSVWRPDRVIVIEFDTREQLERCFGSEEYQQIAFLRESSVDSRAIIVE